MRSITHPARLIHDFAQEVDGFLIRRTSLGPRGEICALAVNEDPSPDLEMSFDVDTKTAYTYKIIRQSEHALQSWELKARYGHFYFYQPIGPDFALLVCARSQRYSQDRYDLNAKVFDTTGTLIREFLLGDGIQDLKVTDTSSIWTSYFDEGIAGNFGWERNDPVGAPGVILWDQYGSQQYAYPQTVEHLIDDCYAMNVVSDSEVWFYFYTDFDLAHFTNGQIEYMPIPVDGADGFVVYRDYFLFRGGYEDQNQYRLFQKQKGGHVQLITEVEFVDNHGNPLTPNWVDCRGDELLMQQKTASYVVNLRDVLYDM
jgi:hypothetical protein